ncbi:uncharacterized protein METZ01_LOCUS514673 [marine metagenome]|uniref:Uncharacterized protein n=1 Tax=marine metagenome TaxID=408172 RepID=A0A383EYS0_9ZZZZ
MHAEVRVTIASFHGPTVDLFFADKSNFDELQKVMAGTLPFAKLDFDYFEYLSRTELRGEFQLDWVELDPKTYYVIVENSAFGVAAPPVDAVDDRVSFAVEVEMR